MTAPPNGQHRPPKPLVLSVAIAVLLLANPALNWLAVRATRSSALAANPTEASFVDSYVAAATSLIQLWAALTLVPVAALVVLAWLAHAGRPVARRLLLGVLVVTGLWAVCGMSVNTGSALWTGPDEWDVVSDSVPGWQTPALIALAGLVVALCVVALTVLRRPTAPPAEPSPPPPA
jgi:hypothetical protein